MNQAKRNARKTLEVKIMFEPRRLAAEHMVDAYSQRGPLRLRKTTHSTPEVGSEAEGTEVATRRHS
jgi:hypothetical protein